MTPTTSSLPAGAVTGEPGVTAPADRLIVPTGDPHLPQNFVASEIGPPHVPQNFPDRAGAGAGAARAATAGDPHLPQNFSVPAIGLPQDAQTYGAVTGAGGGGEAAAKGAGEGAGMGGGEGVTQAAAGGTSPAFAPQVPQNFSSGASVLPQERQVSGAVAAAGGAPAAGSSPRR